MPQSRAIGLQFPLAGMNKRSSYQKQSPFTTPDCLNVRPFDALESRGRGGQRPGLAKAFATQLGGGNPIRMMNTIQALPVKSAFSFEDLFSGGVFGDPLGGDWNTVNVTGADDIPVKNASGAAIMDSGVISAEDHVAIQLKITDLDTGKPRTNSIDIPTWGAVNSNDTANKRYLLYQGLDDTTPDIDTDCVYVEVLTRWFDTYELNLVEVVGGTPTTLYTKNFGFFSSPVPGAGRLSLTIAGTNVTVVWGEGSVPFSQTKTLSAKISSTSTRAGFGLRWDGTGSTPSAFDYTDSWLITTQNAPNMLIASANGDHWYLKSDGTLGTINTGNPQLASDRLLQSVDLLGFLYVADHGPILSNATLASATASLDVAAGFTLTDTAGTFTTGVVDDEYVVEIYQGEDSNVTLGIYSIDSITDATHLELEKNPNADAANAKDVGYRIVRAAKRFDSSNITHTDDAVDIFGHFGDPLKNTTWVTTGVAGSAPPNCPLVAAYQGRVVLGGAESNPNVWYMSRQFDPLDWDYGADPGDSQRAFGGVILDDAKIAKPLTALIPFSDDYLIFGCRDQLWVLRGNPAGGGVVDNLSYKIGIVSKLAWTHGAEGQVIFLSRDGIYGLAPGANSFPQKISRTTLPKELLDIDPDAYDVSLQFDTFDEGVHIFLTKSSGAPLNHWFMELNGGGFFPFTFLSTYDPTVSSTFSNAGGGMSDVLLGCRDGYIRQFKNSQTTDDGTTISSHVLIGPIRMSGSDYLDGMMRELIGVLDAESGTTAWEIHVAESSEAAVQAATTGATPFANGTWTAGTNFSAYPRARGSALVLKIANSASSQWAMERITAIFERLGKHRKAG